MLFWETLTIDFGIQCVIIWKIDDVKNKREFMAENVSSDVILWIEAWTIQILKLKKKIL